MARYKTDQEKIINRRKILNRKLDAIRLSAWGSGRRYIDEIMDKKGKVDPDRLDALIDEMIKALKNGLSFEGKKLDRDKEKIYRDLLFCTFTGASPTRSRYLNASASAVGLVRDVDPMSSESRAPALCESFHDIYDAVSSVLDCDGIENLLLQEMGTDDESSGLVWGAAEYPSFFRYMALSVFWLTGERSFLPDYKGLKKLSEEDLDTWRKAYWRMMQQERDPEKYWLERYDPKIIDKLKLGPVNGADTKKGLREYADWSGYGKDIDAYIKDKGFNDEDSYFIYQSAYSMGRKHKDSRETVISCVERMRKAKKEAPFEKSLRKRYTDERMWKDRKFDSLEDLIYARALEVLDCEDEAAAIRGCDSIEEAEQLDFEAEAAEIETTEEDIECAEWIADNFAPPENWFEDMMEAEERGVREQEDAVNEWKAKLPDEVQKRFIKAYRNLRLSFTEIIRDRLVIKQDLDLMMEVFLYRKNDPEENADDCFIQAVNLLERTVGRVNHQIKKVRRAE